jgi:hypothetical protein
MLKAKAARNTKRTIGIGKEIFTDQEMEEKF